MTYEREKRPFKIRVTTWGPTGVGLSFGEINLHDAFGVEVDKVAILSVAIEDGDRSITYDTESYDVALMVGETLVRDFDDQPIPVEA